MSDDTCKLCVRTIPPDDPYVVDPHRTHGRHRFHVPCWLEWEQLPRAAPAEPSPPIATAPDTHTTRARPIDSEPLRALDGGAR